MKSAPRHPNARAVLGAMAWRIPEDDWESPWSFEGEWIAAAASPPIRSGKNQKNESYLPRDASEALPTFHLQGAKLRFDDERSFPVEDPPLPPPQAPQPHREAVQQSEIREAVPAARKAPTQPAKAPTNTEEEKNSGEESVNLDIPVAESFGAAVPPTKSRPAPVEKAPFEELFKEVIDAERQAAAAGEPVPRSAVRRKLPRPPSVVSWGSLISLALGVLGFMLLAWIYLYDSPRESDEDLRAALPSDQTPTVQSPQKLKAFLTSVQPFSNSALHSRAPWTWDTPSLAAFVQTNGAAFDNLRDLLEDYDWHPHHALWHTEDLSTHSNWRHVGLLLQAQAAYLARRGSEEAAFAAAIDLAEMARRLQEVWAWSGYMQQALTLQADSVRVLAELLKSTRLDSATLGRFQDEFTQCHPEDGLLQAACAAYYVHEKKLLLGASSGELLDTMPGGRMQRRPARLFFKTNETLALFASTFRELRDEIARPPYTRLSVAVAPSRRTRLMVPRFYHPNSSGETYFVERIRPHLNLPEAHGLAQARHALVKCLFAIRRHLADHHSLPAKLADLSPAYLLAIPQDPFSGESPRYHPAAGVLYSTGNNLLDEGGHKGEVPMHDDGEPTVDLGIAMAVRVSD